MSICQHAATKVQTDDGAVKSLGPTPASTSTTLSATSTPRRTSRPPTRSEKEKVFEDNALKVYSRLKAQIEKQARGNA
jgi:hypothetical protein